MAADDDQDIPDEGAIFTFGKSRFAENQPSKFWIRNDRVVHVACGDEHTVLVAQNGRVFSFGINSFGQLGLGHTSESSKPSCIKALKVEKSILAACGTNHTIVATESGRIYTFGSNNDAQLGIEETSATTPVHVDSLEDMPIKAVSAGAEHSAVLNEDGEVFIWGGGSNGQLGNGSCEEVSEPEKLKVPNDEEVISLSCGYYHTGIVTASGKLYTFGETEFGKLGVGKTNSSEINTPQHVESIHQKVKSVSCGANHTAAVTECGKLYTFGSGAAGQLGIKSNVGEQNEPILVSAFENKRIKIASVSCGSDHTAVITDGGKLYSFGDGHHGKLGHGQDNIANQFRPGKVERFNNFVVTKVACGGCHMMVIAHKRIENGDVESEEEEIDVRSSWSNNTLGLSKSIDDLDLSGSISARDRRRIKDAPKSPMLNRTLPRLSTKSNNLPPLSATIQPRSLEGSGFDKGLLPHITAPESDNEKKKNDLSDYGSDEGSVKEELIEETEHRNVMAEVPMPVPRSRKTIDLKKASESPTEESENDSERDRRSKKSRRPVPSPRVTRSPKESEDEEEEEEKLRAKRKKDAKKKVKKKKLDSEEENSEPEEKEEKKVQEIEEAKEPDSEEEELRKIKKGKKSRSEDEDEEDEKEPEIDSEEEELAAKKKKKGKKAKEKKDKKKSKSQEEDDEKVNGEPEPVEEKKPDEPEKPVKKKSKFCTIL